MALCKKRLATLLVAAMMAGCSSVTPMYPDSKNVQAAIKPGDKVYIHTKSDDNGGQWYTVDKVSDTSITSGDKDILYTDIQKMEKLEKPDITNDESKLAGKIILSIGVAVLIVKALVAGIFGI